MQSDRPLPPAQTDPDPLDRTLATVLRTLGDMGIAEASEDSVLSAPGFYDGPTLLAEPGRFGEFTSRITVALRVVPYALEDVAWLTVRQFCEMFVEDSFPAAPSSSLSDRDYEITPERLFTGPAGRPRTFPICFVLGAPRTGTTLLRAMLDRHSTLWAPGELHLATFATMATRAEALEPILRYLPIPELASRCGEPVAAMGETFRRWERRATPTTDVFQALHDADPATWLVDKTPPYGLHRNVLERIVEQFPRAKFIHLTRAPHDMIRSFVRFQLHRGSRRLFETGRNPYQVAEAIWHACNENARTVLSGLPGDRHGLVRYEDLTAAPAEALGSVCELLGRDFEPAMGEPYGTPGAIARGAGDLHIHLKKRVEHRPPSEPFYELGRRCQDLAAELGY